MEIPRFLKPKEYKKLDLPLIDKLDLRRPQEKIAPELPMRISTIVYQRK